MKLKVNFIFLLVLMVSGTLNAQIKGLKIGDQLPDFITDKVLYADQQVLNTAAFKDRLLIIDFWSTTCSGCVAALPKMAALQQQFGEKVKILPVTFEPASLVDGFWKKNKYTKGLSLLTVAEDKQFRNYFPHEAIPHEIWVYRGKVIGITESEYVDVFNITQVLEGKIPDWPLKDDYYTFDAGKTPLFKPDSKQMAPASTPLEYAAISDYQEKNGASAAGVFGSAGIARDSIKKTVRTWFINQSVFSSYLQNWSRLVGPSIMSPNLIVWEVKDPTKYMNQSQFTPDLEAGYRGDWMRRNAICFESMRPDTGQTDKDIARGIIADLDRLLKLKVSWENRKEMVWVLRKTKGNKINSGTQKDPVAAEGTSITSVSALIYQLNQQPKHPYVFDETGSNTGLKLGLKLKDPADLEGVKKLLQPYGLQLDKEERTVNKFIFTEVQ